MFKNTLKVVLVCFSLSTSSFSSNYTCECTSSTDWATTGSTTATTTVAFGLAFSLLKLTEKKIFPWVSANWTVLWDKGASSLKSAYYMYKGVNNPVEAILNGSPMPSDVAHFIKSICDYCHKKVKEGQKELYEQGKDKDLVESLVSEFFDGEKGVFRYSFQRFDIEFDLKYSSRSKLVEISDSTITSDTASHQIPSAVSSIALKQHPSFLPNLKREDIETDVTAMGSYANFRVSDTTLSPRTHVDLESAKRKIKVTPSISKTDRKALLNLIEDKQIREALSIKLPSWLESGTIVREVAPHKTHSSFNNECLTLYVCSYSKEKKGLEARASLKITHKSPELDLTND